MANFDSTLNSRIKQKMISYKHNEKVAFPVGGFGSGMFCVEGAGFIGSMSIHNHPFFLNDPNMYGAIWANVRCNDKSEGKAKVLTGQLPDHKLYPYKDAAFGLSSSHYGLPRFRNASFKAAFPFAEIALSDETMPVAVNMMVWSPFVPTNIDDSSIPAAAFEYEVCNITDEVIDTVIYMYAPVDILRREGDTEGPCHVSPFHFNNSSTGFLMEFNSEFDTDVHTDELPSDKKPHYSAFSVSTRAENATVNCRLFRGGWFDAQTMLWNDIAEGKYYDTEAYDIGDKDSLVDSNRIDNTYLIGQNTQKHSPGGVVAVPMTLEPGEKRTVEFMFSWFSPESKLRVGQLGLENYPADRVGTYRPWYAEHYGSANAVHADFTNRYDMLKAASAKFTDAFFSSTLDPAIIEAIAANLSILKSPTILRQFDGKMWAWEGTGYSEGSCNGSCTHVWNYAQAIANLFPDMERSLRDTEFSVSQNEEGHQNFRAAIPIGETDHSFHAASDGQLGGIMKFYREWRTSGYNQWMLDKWPAVKQSLNYCIKTWDPDHLGVIIEPHHNTYDIEFWGPDALCTGMYLGALKAATLICEWICNNKPSLITKAPTATTTTATAATTIISVKEAENDLNFYNSLYEKCRTYMEDELFNGEYFFQKVTMENLHSDKDAFLSHTKSSEDLALLKAEGPKYQYGKGCLSDGLLGIWLAHCCGIDNIIDKEKEEKHIYSVFKYNYKNSLIDHANPQRPGFAVGDEAGLLLCTWPHGGMPSLPFVYSNEVWTGIEYQVASHLAMNGFTDESLTIVRSTRERYNGAKRNPFNEYECGFWYGRALASYSLLQAFGGARYDKLTRTMYLSPKIKGDFKTFFCCESGFGLVGIQDGKPFIEVSYGEIPIDKWC